MSTKLGFFQTDSKSANKTAIQDCIFSLCIQIVYQNIVNSRIVAHTKIKLKFHKTNGYFDNKNILGVSKSINIPEIEEFVSILQFLWPSYYYELQYANLQYFGKLFEYKG